MKSTTSKFKQIMAAGTARNYLIKIDMTLANNTVLHLTQEDIWQNSLSIETASSGTSSFDIGTAVVGKCTFTINNIDEDFSSYDFFNATAVVWLGLEGDATGTPAVQQYYQMGFYTVDEPQIANGLITLTLLDNMWKFDRPFSGVTLNYPVTAINAVNALCSYCGVQLAGTSANFHGYNFSIAQAPEDKDNMNCREMLQYIAMLGCNFCCIDSVGKLEIKWYDVNATSSTTDVFDRNQSTVFGTEDIEITGVKFVIDETEYTIGSAGYVLELENPLVTTSNVNSVLNLIWDVLDGFMLRTFNLSTASDLAAEIGDKCKIKDYKGNYIYSWITLNTFKPAGHTIQCNAESPARSLATRYSKTVQAAVDVARKQTNAIISNYDLAVQMMNDLAVNAMGGYEEYEDLGTGGRVWYLSNMPITKSAQGVCSFEPNSTVFKRSGSGFFVSRDGGTTWVNGYDMQTGELVVNVLDAIGINFDWARGGTLTLGGYGNGRGLLSILDATNVEKVRGDNSGVAVGSTTGSKLKLTANGKLEYYYDNTLSGDIEMKSINYGTEQNPDYEDTLTFEDFENIRIDAENTRIRMHNDSNNAGNVTVYAGNGSSSSGNLSLSSNAVHIGGYSHTVHTDVNTSIVEVDADTFDLSGVDVIKTGVSSSTSTSAEYVYVLDLQLKAHQAAISKGLITNYNSNANTVFPFWHYWESEGVIYTAIILGEGVTQAVFPDINSNYAYEPFIQCASGQSPPKITDMVISGSSLTVTFTEVTSAQASGNACVIKLWTVV